MVDEVCEIVDPKTHRTDDDHVSVEVLATRLAFYALEFCEGHKAHVGHRQDFSTWNRCSSNKPFH
jgi:hypothetical protein